MFRAAQVTGKGLHKPLSRAWIAGAVCLAEFMTILNGSSGLVALDSVRSELHFSEAGLSWIINSYLLVFGGFLLTGGRLADVFGRRRIFSTGLCIFTVASATCGLAVTSSMLVAARGLQGLGAALMTPAALSILINLYQESRERRRILARWSAVSAVGSTAGLIVGGAIVDATSWRLVFMINIPVAIAVYVVTWVGFPDFHVERSGVFDLRGAVCASSGILILVYAVMLGNQLGWGRPTVWLPALVSIGLLVSFVRNERSHRTPMIRLDLFRRRAVAVATSVMFLTAGASMTITYVATLQLQSPARASAFGTGMAFLPGAIAVLVSTAVIRKLVPLVGIPAVILLGSALIAAGAGLLASTGGHGGYPVGVVSSVVVMSLGSGFATVALNMLALSTLTEEESGVGAGLITTCQQIGGGFWLAVLSSLPAFGGMVAPSTVALLGGVALVAASVGVVLIAMLRNRRADKQSGQP